MVRRARVRLSKVCDMMRASSSIYCAPDDAVFKCGKFGPYPRLALEIDLADDDALAGIQLRHHLAPAVDDGAVAVGLAAVFMLSRLRRGHEMAEVLHSARTQQQMPMG